MYGTAQNQLREAWLEQAASFLRGFMEQHGLLLDTLPRVSTGFPSRGGLSRVIGQCVSPKVCADGKAQIFISPRIADSVEVLGILLHELIHAAVGCEERHGKKFSQASRKVGLVGKPTATTVGESLEKFLEHYILSSGEYPHAAIQIQQASAAGSRLRLYHCDCEPPVKIRAASDVLQARCLFCNSMFRAVPQASRQNKE